MNDKVDVRKLQARKTELETRGELSDPERAELEGIANALDEANVQKAQETQQDQTVQIPKSMLDRMMAMQERITQLEKANPAKSSVDGIPNSEWEDFKGDDFPRTVSLKLYRPEGTRKLYPVVNRSALVYRWEKNAKGEQEQIPYTEITYLDEDGKPHKKEMPLLRYARMNLRVWCTITDIEKDAQRKPVGKTATRYNYDYAKWSATPAGKGKTQYIKREKRVYKIVIPAGNPNNDNTISLKKATPFTVEDRVVNGA